MPITDGPDLIDAARDAADGYPHLPVRLRFA